MRANRKGITPVLIACEDILAMSLWEIISAQKCVLFYKEKHTASFAGSFDCNLLNDSAAREEQW